MRNIALPYREEEREAFLLADKKLKSVGLKGENFSVYKRSVDARKKENIRFVYSIVADLKKLTARFFFLPPRHRNAETRSLADR